MLKQVLKLFINRSHNRRLVAACVLDTQWAHLQYLLEECIAETTEHRWSSIVWVSRKFMKLEWALCAVWSHQRFASESMSAIFLGVRI